MAGVTNEDAVECPLCMEQLEVDDLSFYPCTCGYQICRFCWHRIRTDENGLCPACRSAYTENPADFTPLTQEEMVKLKAEKRHRDQQKRARLTEERKQLATVRVVQRNLVFVVGLPQRLAESDVLKKHDYFGKFGKIHKVVINHSSSYAGNQGPSASAYVTYLKAEDALRAIQVVNNLAVDGKTLRASLGTTKYCSHFMKNQSCPKTDCMYLHEIGDTEASFTKEEMQQGKHQEYERKLHEQLLASTPPTTTASNNSATNNHKERKKHVETSSVSPPPSTSPPPSPSPPSSSSLSSCSSSDSNFNKEQPIPIPTHNHVDEGSNHSYFSDQGFSLPSQESNNEADWMSSSEGREEVLLGDTMPTQENTDWQAAFGFSTSPPMEEPISGEDDLGFDPFHETQKALAEMMETESKHYKLFRPERRPPVVPTRPPPGFTHPTIPMGISQSFHRTQESTTSKLFPFVGLGAVLQTHLLESSPQMPPHNNTQQDSFNIHHNLYSQQDTFNIHNLQENIFAQHITGNSQHKGWRPNISTNSDWANMDPAIVGSGPLSKSPPHLHHGSSVTWDPLLGPSGNPANTSWPMGLHLGAPIGLPLAPPGFGAPTSKQTHGESIHMESTCW